MACLDEKKNLGVGRCQQIPGNLFRFITVPDNFRISAADAADQTKWQAALVEAKADRGYLWPSFSKPPEYNGTETVYRDNPLRHSFIQDGRYRWKCFLSEGLCFHKRAYSHKANNGRIIMISQQNKGYMTYVNDVDGVAMFSGFTLDVFNVENLLWNNSTDPTESPIQVSLRYPSEINDPTYGIVEIDMPWINALVPLTDVDLEMVSSESLEIVVKVKIACDDTPVSGLEMADFVVKDDAGAAVVLTSATEDPDVPGTYTLVTAGDFDDTGTITLKPAADLSVYPDSAYEANTVTTVTPA